MLNLKRAPAIEMDTDLEQKCIDDTQGTGLGFVGGRFQVLSGIDVFRQEVEFSCAESDAWMEDIREDDTTTTTND